MADITCAEERPEKRQRLEQVEAAEAHDEEGPAPPPPSEQISQALAKIANHISNSKKFSKASQLLRQLMDAIDKSHRNEFFQAIKAAFSNPESCIDPLLRKDYVRLMKSVNLRSEVLSKQQRAQLEVYSTWALLRNDLFTDDSFIYNKVLNRIKTAISELSEADDAQEAAWAALSSGDVNDATKNSTEQQQQQQQQQQGMVAPAESKQAAAAKAAADESDPFGLDEFIAREEAAAAAASAAASAAAQDTQAEAGHPPEAAAAAAAGNQTAFKAPSITWDTSTIEVMKKQALLDCLIAAKIHQHKLPWARTSIELLIEEVAKPAMQGGLIDKFVGSQRQHLQELLKFVHAERAARKSGVNRRQSGKGTGDYMTSFERARAEWGAASWVSARGKVGNQGDAKANNWLG